MMILRAGRQARFFVDLVQGRAARWDDLNILVLGAMDTILLVQGHLLG